MPPIKRESCQWQVSRTQGRKMAGAMFHPCAADAAHGVGWPSAGAHGARRKPQHTTADRGPHAARLSRGERRSKGANAVFAFGGNGVERTLRRRGGE